jgi:hypothetical protein
MIRSTILLAIIGLIVWLISRPYAWLVDYSLIAAILFLPVWWYICTKALEWMNRQN